MKLYNKYVISLALSACLVNTLLAFLGQDKLEIYFTTNVIAYLTITLLYIYLNPRARRALNTIGVVFLAGFMMMIVLKVIGILAGI